MKPLLTILALPLILFARPTNAQETNLALHKPVYANSENKRYPVANVVDGRITRESKWMSGNVPPHILEINLQKYCNIDRIVVHTGIPEAERTAAESVQAAGFWSAKNFKLQYWDDANWTDIPNTEVHENRLTDVPYHFSPAINTFKLRFVCDDGEPISIMEIEVFGKATSNMPVAGSAASDLGQKTQRTADQAITLQIANTPVGKTMRYVGYNQGYYVPGSNTSGWLEYAGVNSLRVWTTLNSYVPAAAVQVDATIKDVTEFDRRKDELRASPENNRFIKWDELLPLYEHPEKGPNTNPMVLSYVLSELKRLNIDPIIQVGSTDFDSTWGNKWKQWQRYYALAYYAAKTGDVTMLAMQNEPNHKNSGPMKLDQWIGGMQIVSDALHSAIEDVNKRYGRNLKARMVGPVTAGNNPEWWTAVAQAQRTDYHGRPIDHDLLGIFSTHSYNSPAAGYVDRVDNIRRILTDNQPGGQPLPIVYTEIGRWMNAYLIDKEETMDDPSLFTEWAGIYANNTLNGAYGMWAFKFANTTSDVYPMGIKSGHHFTWQGRRIVEDAYTDLAKGRPVTASNNSRLWPASAVTDNNKTDRSAWHSDSTSPEKWLVIDLGNEKTLGSAVVYTGSAHGDYTSTDRVKNFSLQYQEGGVWKDIPGFTEKNNKYAQVFATFKQPVTTSKIRFFSTGPGMISVREIKVFAAGDGPSNTPDYDVAGIQRTGEVVRLFAKGFKDERPLLTTRPSVKDPNFDALTSYDPASHNYYIWLVQRGGYKDKISLDLSALNIRAGMPVTAESVGPTAYGEVTSLLTIAADKKVAVSLPTQTVTLLTIPSGDLKRGIQPAAADGTVSAGTHADQNDSRSAQLKVALDAARPENNKVGYIRFPLANSRGAERIFLKVYGSNSTDTAIFRFHVYGMPTEDWKQEQLTWKTAPNLDEKEALIKEVGQKAFVAGELAFDHTPKYHYLDVTDLVNRHGAGSITFAFVRETRQLGDDADKGRTATIASMESDHRPELIFWRNVNSVSITARAQLTTPWTSLVTASNAHPEYPRPQLVRKDWASLNGNWDYAITPLFGDKPARWEGPILVPYPIESLLSGVQKKVGPDRLLWYHKTFAIPAGWNGQHILLHFEAVDWDTKVWVNGHLLGEHRGGYDAFSYDITKAIQPGKEQEVVLSVWDPGNEGDQPNGKQYNQPRGIWYTPTTGIWQTAWLEPVPEVSVPSYTLVSDIDKKTARITFDKPLPTGYTLQATAYEQGKKTATALTAGSEIVLQLPAARLWSPASPFLYDLTITLFRAGKKMDEITSYFGMRSIGIEKDKDGFTRLVLNHIPLFQFGTLDQGFWPDGLYTAPTDAALKYDIEMQKNVGFNVIRKHVKVEPQRWYYWCDRLGMLVWQDMPSGDKHIGRQDTADLKRSAQSAIQYMTEWEQIIRQHKNAPSIVTWVPFNEGWGQFATEKIVLFTRQLDPSRLIDATSGWCDRGVGDMHDTHSYPGPDMTSLEPSRATVLGEFGGQALVTKDHMWVKDLSLAPGHIRTSPTPEDLQATYSRLIDSLATLKKKGLSAAIYTQATDVESEVNGLMTYDRKILKIDAGELKKINTRLTQ